MAKRNRIKKPSADKGKNISAEDPPDYDASYPKFSFERLQSGEFCFSTLKPDCKASFSESMFRRRDLTWKEIKNLGRHALGFEKISKHSISAAIPEFITEDEGTLIAFRYNGKKAMVGYRLKDVFYVLWFDPNFRLYKH